MGKVNDWRLTCKDPCIRKRYNELYRPFVVQHSLDTRPYSLQASITGPLTTSQITEFEAISSLRAEGMEYTTRRCRNLKMGGVDFNTAINLLRSRILAWSLQIRKLHGGQASSRYLQRAIVAADLPVGSFDLYLSGTILAQKANFKECQAAKKLHVSSRVSWLHSLARACSQDDGKSEDQHINSLISIEQQQ